MGFQCPTRVQGSRRLRGEKYRCNLGKLENQESGIPFFCQFKGIEEFPKIFRSPNIRRIFSEDDPRVTEVSQTSLTNNRTNEDAPMAFRLICMYPEDYSICYDLSLCRVPVIRESRALIIRACQSRTVKMRVAN